MLGRVARWWADQQLAAKEQREMRELAQNPLVIQGRLAIATHWTKEPSVNSLVAASRIPDTAQRLMLRVFAVARSQDVRMANRQELLDALAAAAYLQVLLLVPPPRPDVTGVRGLLGITGGLKEHWGALLEANADLLEVAHGLPDGATYDDFFSELYFQYARAHAMMSTCNQLRMVIGDHNPVNGRDWLRPAFLLSCAVAEHRFRIGIGQHSDISPADAAKYADLRDLIASGAHFPDLDWETKWGEPIPRVPDLQTAS